MGTSAHFITFVFSLSSLLCLWMSLPVEPTIHPLTPVCNHLLKYMAPVIFTFLWTTFSLFTISFPLYLQRYCFFSHLEIKILLISPLFLPYSKSLEESCLYSPILSWPLSPIGLLYNHIPLKLSEQGCLSPWHCHNQWSFFHLSSVFLPDLQAQWLTTSRSRTFQTLRIPAHSCFSSALLLSFLSHHCCFLLICLTSKHCSVSGFSSWTISVFLFTSLSWWSQLVSGPEIPSTHQCFPNVHFYVGPPREARLIYSLWL